MELWRSSQTLTDSGSSGPHVPRFPVCFLSSLILLCNVTCAPRFFFPRYSVLPNTSLSHHLSLTVGATFVSEMSSKITFMFWNFSAFLSLLRKELSRDMSPRCITDYRCKTGACLIPLHPLGDCWRPSTVPLAPRILSNDVIGEE